MKKIILTLGLFAFIALQVSAQEWRPQLTEYYEPVPPVVTPGQGTSAPSDAIVLFDGTDLSAWENKDGNAAGWKVEGGAMTVVPGTGIVKTKEKFGDVQLHIEWRAPMKPQGQGQDKGNSGVYLQERYEIQVLDCHENETYVNGTTASIYKQYPPMVNVCKPTGQWHTYDIIYRAPRFNEDGSLFKEATLTLLHNGVLVQDHVEIQGNTEYIGLPSYSAHGDGSILLQDHGNETSYRNIWLRKL